MALNLGSLSASVDYDRRPLRSGLDESRRDLVGFRRDAEGNIHSMGRTFAEEGRESGRSFGSGVDRGSAPGLAAFGRNSAGQLINARGQFVAAGRAAGDGFGSGLADGLADAAEEAADPMQALMGVGAALAPMFVAAGVAAAGFGLVAKPSIMAVLTASKDLAASWSTLDKQQRVSALQVNALSDEYKALAESFQPQALMAFNSVVDTGRQLLPQLGKMVAATDQDVLAFLNNIQSFVGERVGGEFLTWVGQQAPAALGLLDNTLTTAGDTALDLVQDLAPLGLSMLQLTNGVLSGVNALANINPELAQLAVSAIFLRGPITSLIGGITTLTARTRAQTAASIGMSRATRAANLLTAVGPALLVAAGIGLAYYTIKTLTATSSTESLVKALEKANGATGNNLAGYARQLEDLTPKINAARAALEAAQAKPAGVGTRGGGQTSDEDVSKARNVLKDLEAGYAKVQVAQDNVRKGSEQLQSAYSLTSAQARALANAAGVDLSGSLDKNGRLTDAAATKIRNYRDAVAAARDPLTQISTALGDAANKALLMGDRVKAAQAAMDAFFSPSIAMFNATTNLKTSFQSLAEALAKSEGSLEGNSEAALASRGAFSSALTSVNDLRLATLQKTGSDEKARAAVERQLPVLYALAGQNKEAKGQVDALAQSMGALPGAVLPSHAAFIRTAAQMGIVGQAAENLYRKLDRRAVLKGDITDLSAKLKQAEQQLDKVPKEKRPKIAADIDDLKAKIKSAQAELNKLQNKTVNVYVGLSSAIRTAKEIPGHKDGGLIRGYDTGGSVNGPGTGTSDSINARLSNGEYVIQADAVDKVGVNALDAINSGRPAGVGTGSRVTSTGNTLTGLSGLSDVIANVIDEEVTTGLALGVKRAQPKFDDAFEYVGGKTRRYFSELGTALNKLGKNAVKSLVAGLSSGDTSEIKTSITSLTNLVKAAFKQAGPYTGIDERLLALIGSTNRKLNGLATTRENVADRLREALAFAANVTSGAQGFAGLTSLAATLDADGNEIAPKANDLIGGLRGKLGQLRAFAGDIKSLVAGGLSKTVLRQLLEAGPEQASALANAIALGGGNAITEINSIQGDIDAAAKSLGDAGADYLYDAGAKAGAGILTGLQGQLDQLDDAMQDLAERLVKAVVDGIAKAQKLVITEEVGAKIESKNPTKPKETFGNAFESSNKSSAGGKKPVAFHIENYHESPRGSVRGTAEELLFLADARG